MDPTTINVSLKVFSADDKRNPLMFFLRSVPLFDNVASLKEYIFKNYKDEIQVENLDFQLDYSMGNRRFNITNEVHLAEAISLQKKGLMTLWLAPNKQHSKKGQKRRINDAFSSSGHSKTPSRQESDEDCDETPLEKKFKRLSEKQPQVEEFKIRVWAKMLINGSHKSEDELPQFPFFTGKKAGKSSAKSAPSDFPRQSTSTSTVITDKDKTQKRTAIIKQLKELKELHTDGILSNEEFDKERDKLVSELSKL